MRKVAFSEELTFGGRFFLNLDGHSEHLLSNNGATWLIPQKTIYFPEGYIHNKTLKKKGIFALAPARSTICEGKSTPGEIPVSPLTGKDNGSLDSQLMDNDELSSVAAIQRIGDLLKAGDYPDTLNLLWQYLALNPHAFKDLGVSPMTLVTPGFKLGEFDPLLLSSGIVQ